MWLYSCTYGHKNCIMNIILFHKNACYAIVDGVFVINSVPYFRCTWPLYQCAFPSVRQWQWRVFSYLKSTLSYFNRTKMSDKVQLKWRVLPQLEDLSLVVHRLQWAHLTPRVPVSMFIRMFIRDALMSHAVSMTSRLRRNQEFFLNSSCQCSLIV